MIHPRSWGPGVHLRVEVQGVLGISESLVCMKEYMARCLSDQSLVDLSVRFESYVPFTVSVGRSSVGYKVTLLLGN